MYGLRPDSDLSFLEGKEICQIAIGPYDVQFNWGNGGIAVWSRFAYKSGLAAEIVWTGNEPKVAACAVGLLQQVIQSVSWTDDGTLSLRFKNGDELTIYDDDPQYEAYSISRADAPIIIV
jgi:Family of unknown function (DUF6188)